MFGKIIVGFMIICRMKIRRIVISMAVMNFANESAMIFVEPNASAFQSDAMCDLMACDNGGNCNIGPACE